MSQTTSASMHRQRPEPADRSTKRAAFTMSLLFALLCATLLVLFSSCNKEEAVEPDPTGSGGSSGTTLLMGVVRDRDGTPVQGASIHAGSLSTTTDDHGHYVIAGLNTGERCYVRAEKSGYFQSSKGVVALYNALTHVDLTLVPDAPNFSLNAGSAQDATLANGATVHLEPNTLITSGGVPVSGTFDMAFVHLDPTDADFGSVTPGGDLLGEDENGNDQQLFSYGMFMVRMTDGNGNELQLADGSNATLTLPVPASMLGNAPGTIPLWHFEETTGRWIEEGEATLQGNAYVGQVAHFSSWNWDRPTDGGTVIGHVFDCNGLPVQGVNVKVGQNLVPTDANGRYTNVVPSGIDFNIQVNAPQLGLVSSIIDVSGIASLGSFTAPDLNIPCPGYLTGTITCSGGGAFQGYAYVSWAGGNTMVPLTAAGTYRIAVPTTGGSGDLALVGTSSGLTQSSPVTFPTTPGQEVNVGTFEICGSGGGGSDMVSTFTLNGDGFNNQTITITAPPMLAYAEYGIADDFTIGFAISGGDQINVGIPGTAAGTWNSLEGSGDIMLNITTAGKMYFLYTNTLTVTQYGAVGQKIKGTFSGTMERIDLQTFDTYYTTVSNGTFEFMRNPDTP